MASVPPKSTRWRAWTSICLKANWSCSWDPRAAAKPLSSITWADSACRRRANSGTATWILPPPAKTNSRSSGASVGFVFQFYKLIPSLTARENVGLITEIHGDPMPAETALDPVNLSARLDHFPALSSGVATNGPPSSLPMAAPNCAP